MRAAAFHLLLYIRFRFGNTGGKTGPGSQPKASAMEEPAKTVQGTRPLPRNRPGSEGLNGRSGPGKDFLIDWKNDQGDSGDLKVPSRGEENGSR